MTYPSIRIEGAILSPDILGRLEDAHGQRPAATDSLAICSIKHFNTLRAKNKGKRLL
jgi:hypothetical protein